MELEKIGNVVSLLVHKRGDLLSDMDCGYVWTIGCEMANSEICCEKGYDSI